MDIPNRRCPVCVEGGHDNGSDAGHLYLMAKGDRWCCNRTDYHPDGRYVFYDNNPEENEPIFDEEDVSEKHINPWDAEESSQDALSSMFGATDARVPISTQSFSDEPARRTLVDFRGVPKETWAEYGVTFEVDETGNPIKQFYPVTLNGKDRTFKVRLIEEKEFFWLDTKRSKKKDLFGMTTVGAKVPKRILLTEGEVDAVSAYQMLSKWNVKCLSGMDGDSLKNIVHNMDFLSQVPDVCFCPDQDAAGNDYCEKLLSLLPECRVMKIPEKDANDMLQKGRVEEFVDAFFRAGNYQPPSIVEVSEIKDSLRDTVPVGIGYPWPSLDAITYGMNPHTILSVGSGPGAGKTTVVRSVQEHLMFNHVLPVGIFSLEESKEMTLRQLVGYRMNQRIHIPGSLYDVEEAMSHAEELEGKAYIYDRRFFNGKWEKIEKAIRFMYALGIKHFFIDPITALVVHLDASGQNTALGKIMSDLSTLMQELPIYVMLVNHLNNPTSGPTHDEGGRVLPSQFTGSKSQWRFSTDMWGIERNSLSEEEGDKNTVTIRNLKHRADGSLMGRVCKLTYNKGTGRLEDTLNDFKSVNPNLTQAKANVSEKHSEFKETETEVKPTTSLNDIF